VLLLLLVGLAESEPEVLPEGEGLLVAGPVAVAEPVGDTEGVPLPEELGESGALGEMEALEPGDREAVGVAERLAELVELAVPEVEPLGVAELVLLPLPLDVGVLVGESLLEALTVLLTLRGALPLGDTEALEPLDRVPVED
jgi:hypothetical protein